MLTHKWDCIFHKAFITDTDKQPYISFLSNLLKDRPYVLLSYMTGILTIAKYSGGSELNMFLEYTMASEERFSAMVVYGFLSYADGQICIPNKELMDKFDDMLMKESSFSYVYRLAKESARMLSATLSGDTDTITSILEYAHNTESPLLAYNHETELT